ncbi:MAG: MFS transporter [Deltaproteobacteria bacterium]|nr:MFS transporter [Deltaproteobacteria bacterium]
MKSDSLKFSDMFAYSGIALALAIMADPIPTIINQFYVKYTEVTLAAVGAVLFFSRFIDAATDPAIGLLSDRTRTPIGKRKPWIIGGGAVAMIGVYYFFNPSADSGILYFAVFCNIYYLCRTLIAIPYAAWGSEITRDYHERARIGAWYGGLLLTAQLLFLAFPVIVSSPLLPLFDSPELGPEMISLIGWVGVVFIPFSIGLAVWLAPKGDDLNGVRVGWGRHYHKIHIFGFYKKGLQPIAKVHHHLTPVAIPDQWLLN